jgi:magnesium-transporting ATPase (P-type)
MTGFFALFIFMGILNAFNSRTTNINIFKNITKNKIFIILFLCISIVQIFLIYFGGSLFRTYGLNIKELINVLLISLSVIPIDMIRKIILNKKNETNYI